MIRQHSGSSPKRSMPRRVILHAGMHKTGTTSVQTALSRTPGLVWPPTEPPGPGHARLVWRALGLRGEHRDPDILWRTVEMHQAELPGRALVISAEACIFAIESEDRAEAFRRLAKHSPTELVLTVRPDDERLSSFCQEQAKQGVRLDVAAPFDQTLASTPLSGGGMVKLVEAAPWEAVHLVRTRTTDPGAIFRAFSAILGTPVAEVTDINRRLDPGVTMTLELLTRHVEATSSLGVSERVALAKRLWADLIVEMPALVDVVEPVPPPEVLAALRTRWLEECRAISMRTTPEVVLHPETFREELAVRTITPGSDAVGDGR